MVEIANPTARRSRWNLGERLEALDKLEKGVKARREEILGALADDLEKPEIESFLAEYWFVLQEIRLVRKKLKKWLKPRKVGSPFWFWPCRSQVELEPFGRVLVIAPWNYPVQLALAPLISAVAAGNSVVLKPSEMAPACGGLLADLLNDCFPPEQVTVRQGGREVAEELLDASFDFIFFTGSTEVGRSVAEKAGRTLTPTVLELGGKCPCVVDATADLEIAARRILIGKFFNGGQTCFAPDFVAVEESVREKLVAEMERLLMELPWEDEISRIINRKHYERILGLVSGREIRKGEDDAGSLRIAPRILPEADWCDAAMGEEIFGPVLPVVGFTGNADLIAKLRKYGSPLAFYLFSRDRNFIDTMKGAVRSGSVCLNDTMKQSSSLDLPFGGVGESGSGRYRGRRGVETFCYERAVMKRYFWKDIFELLPPRDKMLGVLKRWL